MMLHVSGLASRPHVDERPRDEDASAVTEPREAGPLSLSSQKGMWNRIPGTWIDNFKF